MDKLTKDQKDEYATSLAAIALYDGGVSVNDCALCTIAGTYCDDDDRLRLRAVREIPLSLSLPKFRFLVERVTVLLCSLFRLHDL